MTVHCGQWAHVKNFLLQRLLKSACSLHNKNPTPRVTTGAWLCPKARGNVPGNTTHQGPSSWQVSAPVRPIWLWPQVIVASATATVLLQASSKMNKWQNLASNSPVWELLVTTLWQPWSSSWSIDSKFTALQLKVASGTVTTDPGWQWSKLLHELLWFELNRQYL